MKVLLKLKIKIPARALNYYILAWKENQRRTPTDRCAVEHYIWPVIKRMSEVYGPTTREKEIKVSTTQQNKSFFYHILVWKTNLLSRTSHQMFTKKQSKQQKQ